MIFHSIFKVTLATFLKKLYYIDTESKYSYSAVQ